MSQSTPLPSGVEVVNILEKDTITNVITQQKNFNQCDSASTFKAQIQFSQTNSQKGEQELVLGASAGGEVGVSEIAEVTIEGKLEKHFRESTIKHRGHEESVAIEVPPRTQQEYTLVWRESRREGTVQYIENGESKAVNYSYRIGLELVSATGRDLPCPGQEPNKMGAMPTPTPYPTYTPYPTPTPYPTYTPYIVPTPEPKEALPTLSPTSPPKDRDTKPGTVLSPGEAWREEGVIAVLKNVEVRSKGLYLTLAFQNSTGQSIVFEWDRDINVMVRDNLGNIYSWQEGIIEERISLDHGETKNLFSMSFSGPVYQQDVTSVTLTIRDISQIDEATWEIPIYH
jgi:hypothetical protein